jgi:tetratricopeptide (TPR) repeat protein
MASVEEIWGLLEEKMGNPDAAIEHFKASVEAEPRRQLPLRRLAELYALQMDWANGAHWMEQYVATEPAGLGHQYGTLADYYLAAEDLANAERVLKVALEKDRHTYWARYRMARLLEEEKNTGAAIEQYEIALRYGLDRDPEIYLRLASLYRAGGRSDDAEDLLQTGLRIFPTNIDLYRQYSEMRAD